MIMLFLKRFSSSLVLVLVITTSTQTLAITTFARQTGLPCAACHFQNYPASNTFGRSFKANGYTLAVLENRGEAKSIPLN